MKHDVILSVTMMLQSYQDQIISELVKNGYSVKAMAADGRPCLEQGDRVSVVMNLIATIIRSRARAKRQW